MHYVAKIDEVIENEIDVTYLKREGNKFGFPKNVKKCAAFLIDFAEFNVK